MVSSSVQNISPGIAKSKKECYNKYYPINSRGGKGTTVYLKLRKKKRNITTCNWLDWKH